MNDSSKNSTILNLNNDVTKIIIQKRFLIKKSEANTITESHELNGPEDINYSNTTALKIYQLIKRKQVSSNNFKYGNERAYRRGSRGP